MPTYEYVCHSCGHAWETVQRISEDPLKECPACKKQTAERQISAGAGFILKGGGWYSDLYSSPKPAASGEGKSESKPEGKGESKADKPAEKSDAAAKPASSPPPAKSD
jgi:putative FmdB family regulatory protein